MRGLGVSVGRAVGLVVLIIYSTVVTFSCYVLCSLKFDSCILINHKFKVTSILLSLLFTCLYYKDML